MFLNIGWGAVPHLAYVIVFAALPIGGTGK